MNLLNVFDNIEIKNDTRLSKEDLNYLKELQIKFDLNKEIHFKLKKMLEDEFKNKSNLINNTSYIEELMIINYNAFQNRAKSFINNIYTYFNKKYSCNLKNTKKIVKHDTYINNSIEELNQNLKQYEKLDYNEVLDDIFEQLGGMTFVDRREAEISKYLKDHTKSYKKNKRVKIKNNKIIIQRFFYIDRFWEKCGFIELDYNSKDYFKYLFDSISIFNPSLENPEEYKNEITKSKNDNLIKTHNLNLDNIKSIKLFKNGRIDMEFSTPEKANEYAKRFLSYEV